MQLLGKLPSGKLSLLSDAAVCRITESGDLIIPATEARAYEIMILRADRVELRELRDMIDVFLGE